MGWLGCLDLLLSMLLMWKGNANCGAHQAPTQSSSSSPTIWQSSRERAFIFWLPFQTTAFFCPQEDEPSPCSSVLSLPTAAPSIGGGGAFHYWVSLPHCSVVFCATAAQSTRVFREHCSVYIGINLMCPWKVNSGFSITMSSWTRKSSL